MDKFLKLLDEILHSAFVPGYAPFQKPRLPEHPTIDDIWQDIEELNRRSISFGTPYIARFHSDLPQQAVVRSSTQPPWQSGSSSLLFGGLCTDYATQLFPSVNQNQNASVIPNENSNSPAQSQSNRP